MEIKLKKNESFQAAIIKHVGPYSDAGRLYNEIAKWITQKQLCITGPPFGWFYDNPEEVPAQKLRSEVGFPFEAEAKPEGRIEIKKIPVQEVLYTTHRGPYREVGPAYSALFQYARKHGYVLKGCPIEIYLNDPATVPENELLTEIQLPVKKK
ncbi:MAG: GyrI-like domain-containing protein [Candidatus Bathyarchaeia archaeon]|jgi:effector-binding domain-containing protein|nr:GyrI-like domain-containing protein [Candidatus Bathyarchaeota archaeon A05DMB-4]MDH7595171.1 GyrI-like domain-containing protein [Candidatus Bathyarchaeota archaeon]